MWNGTLGLVAMASIGQVELGATGRSAWMASPFEMLGPFSLDELEACGRIAFAACVVLSRQRWQDEQVALRQEAQARRRAAHERMQQEQARFHQHGHARRASHPEPLDERPHRETLNLPIEGRLEPSRIKSAYRRLAQKAHPDMGGSHERFVRITQARKVLLERHS